MGTLLCALYKVPLMLQIRHFDSKAGIVTVRIWSTNFHSFNVSSYHQMSLDPLNVGLLKTWGENLVIAFSCFFFFFFLVDDQNAISFSVCKLALDASFQQIDRKHNCLYFTFLREKYLFFPRKNTNDIWLRIPLGLFLLRGRSSRRRYVYAN